MPTEPSLAKYVLSAGVPSLPRPLAEIEPVPWDGALVCPRLACAALPEDEIENASAPVSGCSAAANPRPSIPSWAALTFVVSIAMSGFGILLFGRSVDAKDRPAAILAAPVHKPLPQQVFAAPLRPANLSVQAIGRSWVTVCADNKVLFSELFTAGDRRTFKFSEAAVVRVGNAGAVQVVNDGEFTGALGFRGQVRIVEFTPGDSHFLEDGESADCTYGH
jgi:Domain of unknown function (DUF4115)